MRVWVDITDASHVVFFAPIVRRLEDAGHTVTVTARRFAGADLVLRRYGLGGVLTTGHRGGGLGTRAVGLVNRTAQLLGSASSGRFDVAAGSHASDFVLTAWTLGIPQLTFLDDERLRRGNAVNVRLVDEVAVPEAIPPATLAALGAPPDKLFRYPGFKEEYYLYDFSPDPRVLASSASTAGASSAWCGRRGRRARPAAAPSRGRGGAGGPGARARRPAQRDARPGRPRRRAARALSRARRARADRPRRARARRRQPDRRRRLRARRRRRHGARGGRPRHAGVHRVAASRRRPSTPPCSPKVGCAGPRARTTSSSARRATRGPRRRRRATPPSSSTGSSSWRAAAPGGRASGASPATRRGSAPLV